MTIHEPGDSPEPPALAPATRDQPDPRHGLRQAKDEAFSAFYRATVRSLVGFLVNQGAGLYVAADIAQDTMLSAYERWDTIDHPRAWVHTVASRALLRRIASCEEQPVEQVPEPTSLLADPDAIAAWEARHDLLPLLRSLPPRQRQVLAWALSGFTPGDIAEQLGMSDDAVRASLYKARRAVAEAIKEREEGQ
ncbi:sigma-70 family RNA polymerase sigma factor [Streptomyces sp. ME02-6987-2C]|uniref:RNA polymerase sigma factor n=1 Tax=unclassified Streptomyces TaxID=2593676 RepID=UPI0029BCF1A6|nr:MULTISPECIES: sigma-70 family RNA polymerase sigma factor [unclassified Streptomyces]MDX3371012.1 sigma-70 family RNA polymerase sigma factor [Streptomyces sp. ME02-6987-2C]MDX3426939.1 sigma-70 family RNA polymerase sigma factor [Streptomyces sp. ME02-6985-2c]